MTSSGRPTRRVAAAVSPILLLLGLAGCGGPIARTPGAGEIPTVDTEGMEARVAQSLGAARAEVEEHPGSAEAWGHLGMVLHAHELWSQALVAYGRAEALDPEDARWPYYRGDVLAIVGTDLAGAAGAFRRTLELRPGYGPAHMRLGQALLSTGDQNAARTELERALELAPDLQPARLALAQAHLAEGRLESSASLLEQILEEQPRHRQALTTLGQVYMRLGRRDEARQVALRARDAAVYSLISDPLMQQVVQEGVSSVLLWERAKAFLDNGNYEQAARGLQQVVELLPGNPDVHQQLAIAYGNLGQGGLTRRHLQRAVELEPDRIDALIQLATVLLEANDPKGAIPHLEHILALDAGDPDAPWLLGKAHLMAGSLELALRTFEAAGASRRQVPGWARNEWGSALAQSGRADEALAQFRRALEADADDAQALFFIGLLFEGRGETGAAIEHFCRSLRLRPDSPARGRLRDIGGSCPG